MAAKGETVTRFMTAVESPFRENRLRVSSAPRNRSGFPAPDWRDQRENGLAATHSDCWNQSSATCLGFFASTPARSLKRNTADTCT